MITCLLREPLIYTYIYRTVVSPILADDDDDDDGSMGDHLFDSLTARTTITEENKSKRDGDNGSGWGTWHC
jgi:hypothetical protein